MTRLKEGDLVVLKSGGPVMTVDAVNTSIFDDDKVTGISCVWFVGDKLQRVRFDYHAVEPAGAPDQVVRRQATAPDEVAGDYSVSLDAMLSAMNVPADEVSPGLAAEVREAPTKRARAKRKLKATGKTVTKAIVKVASGANGGTHGKTLAS